MRPITLSMARTSRALTARFDAAALRPFADTAAAEASADRWPALRVWLGQPTADGQAPCAPAAVPLLSLACSGGADVARAFSAAAALGLWLDGSLALRACRGPVQRLGMRARVKVQDVRSAWDAQPHAVWDSGFVPDEPSAWQAFADFRPRRASFIVLRRPPDVDRAGTDALAVRAVRTLLARQRHLACPVQVLLLGRPWPGVSAQSLPGPPDR